MRELAALALSKSYSGLNLPSQEGSMSGNDALTRSRSSNESSIAQFGSPNSRIRDLKKLARHPSFGSRSESAVGGNEGSAMKEGFSSHEPAEGSHMSGRRAEEGLQRGTGGKEMEVADEDQMVEGLRRAREGSCDEGASSVAVRNAVVSASPRFEGGEDRHVASRSSLLVNNDCQQRKGVEARSDKADFEEGHIATEDSLGNEGLTRRRLNMRELKLSSRRWNDDEDRILIDYVKVSHSSSTKDSCSACTSLRICASVLHCSRLMQGHQDITRICHVFGH